MPSQLHVQAVRSTRACRRSQHLSINRRSSLDHAFREEVDAQNSQSINSVPRECLKRDGSEPALGLSHFGSPKGTWSLRANWPSILSRNAVKSGSRGTSL